MLLAGASLIAPGLLLSQTVLRRGRVDGIAIGTASMLPSGQTFSVGVVSWDGQEISDELVARADRARPAAKAAGRDRIVVGTTASFQAAEPRHP